jgi:alcohol dehydrogenase
VIEAIGPAAAARWGVNAGARVAVEVFQRCGRCDACRAGAYNRCRAHGLADMYGYVDVARPPSLWGGYAELQYLAPDTLVVPVPDGLDPATATLFNPIGAGIRWGVTVPATRPGDVVAILGPGIRGLATAAAVLDAGASFVLVTGAGARDAPRLATAERFGVDLTLDITQPDSADPARRLRDATGGRLADVVVDVTAKAPGALAHAVALARPGGTIVLAGTRGAPVPDFAADAVVYKELRVVGALGVDTPAYTAAFELLASGRYPFADVERRREPLDAAGVADLLETMAGEKATPPLHAVVTPGR